MSLPNNKTAPQKRTIIRGLTVLFAYGHFKWPEFKNGPHEPLRFKVFLDKSIREKKIAVGYWHKRT